jgi:PIN domain nuclease of toxin-antitoxin system
LSSLILDTHIWLWLATGSSKLSKAAREQIENTSARESLLLSAISVWELAMLEDTGKVQLPEPVEEWIASALADLRIQLIDLSADILVHSVRLPGNLHKDPADRIIIATAQKLQALIVTKDQRMIEYARGGHVQVVRA